MVNEIRNVAEEFEGCLLKVTVGDYNELFAQVDCGN